MTTVRLRDYHWVTFDEFVNRIGAEGDWEYPDGIDRPAYRTLVAAGLLERRPKYPTEMYGLTGAGRRKVCERTDHDFDKDKPTPDGCAMCDATACDRCLGFGCYTPDRGRRRSLAEFSCGDCNGSGLTGSP